MNLAADPGLPLLLRRLEGETLPSLAMYKDKCLQRRLAVRMRACGVGTIADYVGVLDADPAEVDRLRRALTINVTQFYRNPEAWTRLAAELSAIEWRQRVVCSGWSAGCASGEEAYTLAMVLSEAAGPAPPPVIRVDGTDVDPGCLQVANEGRYPERSLADVPMAVRDRWTAPEADHRLVGSRLRSRVRWHRHDLGREPPPAPPYDVITCRNVLIYFERASQERVLAGFVEALRPGGLLLLGKVEMLVGPARDALETVDGRERLFRRQP
jgi:chemotaxis protein methyltransferase CheR